jgi:hypothetical protein
VILSSCDLAATDVSNKDSGAPKPSNASASAASSQWLPFAPRPFHG